MSLLAYVGGKYKLKKKIIEHIPIDYIKKNKVNYYEPFVGSGAIVSYLNELDILQGKIIINDLDSELINIYKILKDKSQRDIFINKIKKIEFIFDNLKTDKKRKKYFNDLKIEYKNCSDKNKKSLLKIIISKKSYSGIINSTFSYLNHRVLTKTLNPIINLLDNKNIKIYNKDYRFILNKVKKGDFVYMDPPYNVKDVKQFYKYIFSEDDFISFFNFLDKLNMMGVLFLVSLNNDEWVKEKLKKYKIIEFNKKSGINNLYKTLNNEILIMNTPSE